MTDEDKPDIRDQLEGALGDEVTGGEPDRSFASAEDEAAYWRTRFEEERERLAKLWVAYRDVEAELSMRERETDAIAQRKAAAQLAQAEQAREEAAPGDQPGVLAIAPPDQFEVMAEAEQRDVVVGRGTSFPLVFVNRGDETITVSLSVDEATEDWSALTTETEIELEGRSSRTIYVIVRPPADAPVGAAGEVTVDVETSEGTAETVHLRAEVVPDEEAAEPVPENADGEPS